MNHHYIEEDIIAKSSFALALLGLFDGKNDIVVGVIRYFTGIYFDVILQRIIIQRFMHFYNRSIK